MANLKVSFYGVRGSIATPGMASLKYGGNTPCVYIEANPDFHLVLDAGTGIVSLGEKLANDDKPIYLLLSHNHWDHIQGFPFFRPAYQAGREINIIPGNTKPFQGDAILAQMSATTFPVSAKQLAANIRLLEFQDLAETIRLGDLIISRKQLNHPQSGSAYLLKVKGRSFGYCTDNELCSPDNCFTSLSEWRHFFQGIDLLIHDAQYVPNDFPMKSGWGHSSYQEVVELALAAEVKHLCLFSHDHRRTDDEIEDMLVKVNRQVEIAGSELKITVAREQETIVL